MKGFCRFIILKVIIFLDMMPYSHVQVHQRLEERTGLVFADYLFDLILDTQNRCHHSEMLISFY
jgi:hypothetical protein